MKHNMDHNHQHEGGGDYYTCPMHPETKEDKPDKCPKCGGMDLVKKSEMDSGHAEHARNCQCRPLGGKILEEIKRRGIKV